MEESHTVNHAHQLEHKFDKWEIRRKIMKVVTDNAKNAINLLAVISETYDLT